MIHVEVQTGPGIFSLRVEGHAGYNPGQDIVCAGCSAIVYALMGVLRQEPEHVYHFSTQAESGHAWVYAEGDETAGALFRMASLGLMQIEAAHPKHVRVTWRRE